MIRSCYKELIKIFQNQIGNFQDIIIEPKILEIGIAQTGFISRTVQINAQMINALIGPKSGMVIRGNSNPQEFAEYWTLQLINKPEQKLLLSNINQV